MSPLVTHSEPPRCSRCGDRMYGTDDGRYVCVQCAAAERARLRSRPGAARAWRGGMLILQKIGSSRAVPAIDWFPRAIVAGCAASTVMLIGFVLAYGVAAWLVAAPL